MRPTSPIGSRLKLEGIDMPDDEQKQLNPKKKIDRSMLEFLKVNESGVLTYHIDGEKPIRVVETDGQSIYSENNLTSCQVS